MDGIYMNFFPRLSSKILISLENNEICFIFSKITLFKMKLLE